MAAEDSFRVRVTPKAGRNRVEVEGELVRVWVTAVPADGEANKAVRDCLAKALRIAKGKVELVSGGKSREKVFRVEGMSSSEVLTVLGR